MILVRKNLGAVLVLRNVGGSKTKRFTATEASLKPWTEIPGLKSYPILGALPNFLPVVGSIGPILGMYDVLDKLYKMHGPIVRLGKFFDRNPMIVLFDPDQIDQVSRSENIVPNRDGFKTMDYFRRELHPDIYKGASGLMSAQGAEWKNFRSKVNPSMLLPHLIKLYKGPIDKVADEMMNRLKGLINDPEYLRNNFDFEMTRWSLESIAVVALGGPIGCLKDDLPEDAPVRKLIQSTRDVLMLSFDVEMGPPVWRWYKTSGFKKLMNAFETQMRISQMYIDEATEKIKNREEPIAPEDKSILEKLLEVDPKIAIVMAMDMLFAGVDTVGHQMISILYLLALNPDKQTKLREEIRSDSKGVYLKACIKEAMRLMPALGNNVRGTTKEHVIGGYLIPKGIDILFGQEYLLRQDKYYPRANDFIPERWVVDKSDPLHYGHAHPMLYMPFGFGTRSCIGRRIAELEMESFLAKFIDTFEVKWSGDRIKNVTRSVNIYLKPFNFVMTNAPR